MKDKRHIVVKEKEIVIIKGFLDDFKVKKKVKVIRRKPRSHSK